MEPIGRVRSAHNRRDPRRASWGAPMLGSLLALIATACGSAATPSSSSPTPTQHPTPSPRPNCPNPDGGQCLGPIAAGSYTTVTFQPRLTYRVQSGWANFEDLPGNFLLVPPGGNLPGVNAGTSDYVGVYTSIAGDAQDCSGQPAPGVGLTASDIATWMTQQRGLTTAGRKQVAIGGLRGEVLDIRMTKGWKGCRPCPTCAPGVQLIIGVGPSSLEHGMFPGLTIRLYLLDYAGGALAIEIDDVSGGSHLDAYSELINTFQFAS